MTVQEGEDDLNYGEHVTWFIAVVAGEGGGGEELPFFWPEPAATSCSYGVRSACLHLTGFRQINPGGIPCITLGIGSEQVLPASWTVPARHPACKVIGHRSLIKVQRLNTILPSAVQTLCAVLFVLWVFFALCCTHSVYAPCCVVHTQCSLCAVRCTFCSHSVPCCVCFVFAMCCALRTLCSLCVLLRALCVCSALHCTAGAQKHAIT